MLKIYLIYFLLICSTGLAAAKYTIRYPKPQSGQDYRHIYRVELLKLALKKSAAVNESFEIIYSKDEMVQSRSIFELKNNKQIDVIALPTNQERENELLPVRIPIMKGLLGYRIFLIRKNDRQKFSLIINIEDLKKFNAGFGHDWADTEILKSNGLPVITAPNYESLFLMLNAGRFDYFPRGVNEAFSEISSRQNNLPDLEVENSLALYYPFPVYFFVNKENKDLADRLEKGLLKAIDDKSFNQLFDKHFRSYIKMAKFKERKVFTLKNPTLPEKTPFDNKKLWLDISK